jgi:hypothetical protein
MIHDELAFRARLYAPQPCIRQVLPDPEHDAVIRIGSEAPGGEPILESGESGRHRPALRTCINGLEAEMAALKAASGGIVLTLGIFTAAWGRETTSRLPRVPDRPSIVL